VTADTYTQLAGYPGAELPIRIGADLRSAGGLVVGRFRGCSYDGVQLIVYRASGAYADTEVAEVYLTVEVARALAEVLTEAVEP